MKILTNCYFCNSKFHKEAKHINEAKKLGYNIYCSNLCANQSKTKDLGVLCANCDLLFIKTLYEIKHTKNNFCTHSCAAIYNNKHKKHGTRTSKFEKWLQTNLLIKFPDLEFKFNQKSDIGSELDIYIPSLKLAFEINGILHYQPIYGEIKLKQIQENDVIKKQNCESQNINLQIIDVSTMTYFKESKVTNLFSEICNSIVKKIR